MAALLRGWVRVVEIPSGPVLYAIRRAQYRDDPTPLWKLGRTNNLARRLREFPDVMTPIFARPVAADESALDLERVLHDECPFPRAGGGREFYRCSEIELEAWLNGEA